MRTLIVLVVLIGFLVGTFSVMVDACEELSFDMGGEFTNGDSGTGDSLPAPCGEGGGGGPAVPG